MIHTATEGDVHNQHIAPVHFVCFVALRPKSTAMVIAGRSVHLITLFSWAGLNKRLTSNSCTYFRLLNQRKGGE